MIAAAMALLAADPLAVPPQPIAVVSAEPQALLPADTAVKLITTAQISSRSVVQGQRFPLEVAEDVVVNSRVVIPRGTPATGEVEALSGKGMFGKAAKLTLSPLFVQLDGQRVNLAGATDAAGSDATAAAAVSTVLFGVFGLAITGKSAVLPAGSVLYGRVRNDFTPSAAR